MDSHIRLISIAGGLISTTRTIPWPYWDKMCLIAFNRKYILDITAMSSTKKPVWILATGDYSHSLISALNTGSIATDISKGKKYSGMNYFLIWDYLFHST